MASGPYSFIDIAVLEEVRARFAAGDALAILTPDLAEVIWANGAGALLLGQADIESVMGASAGLSRTAQRQIAAAPGFPHTVRNRTLAVRLATDLVSRTVAVEVNSLRLPGGEQALLLAVANQAPDAGDVHLRIIEGFEEAGYFAALIDADAQVTAATEGFDELGIGSETLHRLVAEVAHESDRLVKRPVAAHGGRIPAGIARLVDEPRLHLLIAIDALLDPPAQAETMSGDSALPEPSESDLIERIREDSNLPQRRSGEPASIGRHDNGQPEKAAAAPPLRFIWRTDNEGRLTFMSPEFLQQVSAHTSELIGKPFLEISDSLGLDPDGEVATLLQRRDTWSGRTVNWPLADSELVAPVDLAALPTYNRSREFEGFRGFGVLRAAEAIAKPAPEIQPEASSPPPPAEAGETPAQLSDTDPYHGEKPVLSISDSPERRQSDKVIRLAERRSGTADSVHGPQLSAGDRNALEEIRRRLSEDYDQAKAGTPSHPTKPADEDVATSPDVPALEEASPPQPASDHPQPPVQSWQPDSHGVMPSAFSLGRHQQSLDPDFLSGLPLAILVHAGDELYFANAAFLALTGFDNLDHIRRAGGLDHLFADPANGDEPEQKRRPLLRTASDDTIAVEAHLQSVRWQDRSALLLSVTKVPSNKAAPAAIADPQSEVESPQVAAQVFAPADAATSTAEFAALEKRVAEMRTIIDTATDGVVLITRDNTIRSISHPAEALFGVDSAAVEGQPFASLFAVESQKSASDYLAGLSDNGVASVLNDGREVIGREAEGGYIPLFMTIGRLPDDSGYCAVVRDITQWKRAEEELTQARAVAERSSSQKTEFLARVSHEIRTPLNAIIGFSELMMDEKFGPIGSDRYRDYLRDINKSGNHVLDLVNDLLDISKIEAGEQEMNYESVSLNDTLAECVAMMQPQANRERVIIRSSLSSRLPEVVADLRSVRQIALNLLSNAIRYTQAGGQVIVSTSYEPSGEVVMRVRDTGIGMTLSEIDQALKPFKQINALKRGRHDGTGLGLPLTKAMVEANRAKFVIASTPGEGTLVEVTFPSTRVLAE